MSPLPAVHEAASGIPLERALWHLTDQDLWSDYRWHLLVRPGERCASWVGRPAFDRETARARLLDDLLARWRSGALRFAGVPSGAASPVAIPPDACPSRDCFDIAGGSLSGPRGVFSGVRVRSTTGLLLRSAMRVFGPWEAALELEHFEARGFVESRVTIVPHELPPAEEERASGLRERLWRALIADLASGRLRGDGRDPKAGYSAGRAVIAPSDWPILVEAGLHYRHAEFCDDIDFGGIALRDARVWWPGDDTIARAPAAAREEAAAGAESRPAPAGAVPPPKLTSGQAFLELVIHLRAMAKASPDKPTVNSKELWKWVQRHPRWGGVITQQAYGEARKEAFADHSAWQQKGRPPSAEFRRKSSRKTPRK